MAKKTGFEKLTQVLVYGNDKISQDQAKRVNQYTLTGDDVLFKTTNQEELEFKKRQIAQTNYLANQWYGSGKNMNKTTGMVTNNVKLMFRDCDLMDGFPEIGAALDIFAEEACTTSTKGHILNISSTSKRIKTMLEDLFINRLDGHVTIPMWIRAMCKYGNCFVMLNVTDENGVIGGRMMPVYEVDRLEPGFLNPYIGGGNTNEIKQETEFIWTNGENGTPLKNWQVAHFRLLTDSLYLPYGVSVLHKARRHWRILSMMEDMMLIYRMERSIERRVFKVFVGNIDDADIPAYMNDIANSFKRTPIFDPQTGQLDLRKNQLDVTQDFFIPTRTEGAQTPIDVLPAATNLDKIEDLKYIQNKVLSALRIPKAFLNFEEAAGGGKNLALADIRFARTVNRIQQAIIMELNKIAIIHLYLNGFEDEINNFKITMNSPSTQSEILKLEELSKKISLVSDATKDIGTGLQIMSLTKAQREILGWSDEEISENMLEIRMERALASELTKTDQIIKRTGFFNKIDKLYGDPNAEYISETGEAGGIGDLSGGGGFGGGSASEFGDSFSNPEVGGENNTEFSSEPEETTTPMEGVKKKIDKLLVEAKTIQKENFETKKNTYFDMYLKHVIDNKTNKEVINENTPIYDKSFKLNEEIMQISKNLEEKHKK